MIASPFSFILASFHWEAHFIISVFHFILFGSRLCVYLFILIFNFFSTNLDSAKHTGWSCNISWKTANFNWIIEFICSGKIVIFMHTYKTTNIVVYRWRIRRRIYGSGEALCQGMVWVGTEGIVYTQSLQWGKTTWLHITATNHLTVNESKMKRNAHLSLDSKKENRFTSIILAKIKQVRKQWQSN